MWHPGQVVSHGACQRRLIPYSVADAIPVRQGCYKFGSSVCVTLPSLQLPTFQQSLIALLKVKRGWCNFVIEKESFNTGWTLFNHTWPHHLSVSIVHLHVGACFSSFFFLSQRKTRTDGCYQRFSNQLRQSNVAILCGPSCCCCSLPPRQSIERVTSTKWKSANKADAGCRSNTIPLDDAIDQFSSIWKRLDDVDYAKDSAISCCFKLCLASTLSIGTFFYFPSI